MILGVNVDHIATLRQARLANEPDPLAAARLALRGGADGVTVHLREDRRHIQDSDLYAIRPEVAHELNLEMAATDEMIGIAIDVMPDLVTLVPEKRMELTTEGGLDVRGQKANLKAAINRLKAAGIPVSLFINPDIEDIAVSKEIDADMVEIHTGLYSNACCESVCQELERVEIAVKKAYAIGLLVNAGHGLNYHNVSKIAAMKEVRGLYIGHSIIARSVMVGIEAAVREMKGLVEAAR